MRRISVLSVVGCCDVSAVEGSSDILSNLGSSTQMTMIAATPSWLPDGTDLHWTFNPINWRDRSVISITSYQRLHFPRLMELSDGKTYLRELPWRSLTQFAITSTMTPLLSNVVSQTTILDSLHAASLHILRKD